jgi:hypothetical protein
MRNLLCRDVTHVPQILSTSSSVCYGAYSTYWLFLRACRKYKSDITSNLLLRFSSLSDFDPDSFYIKVMAHTRSQPAGQMSPCSIPAIQERHDSVNIPLSHLSASLVGSAKSCLAISFQIRYSSEFRRATDCMGSGFIPMINEFFGMGSAFQEIERAWSEPSAQKLWTENATRTVKIVQGSVQEVAISIREIADQCKAWTVVVPDRLFYDLQKYQIWLQRQQLILNLLALIMYVMSPSEERNSRHCSRHRDNISL